MIDGKYFVAGCGVIMIGTIETVAIATGQDGAYLSACVGAIGTIVGLCFGLKITEIKEAVLHTSENNTDTK